MVGPRPLLPEEDVLITGYHRQRLDMLPGVTGHCQVRTIPYVLGGRGL